MARIWPIWNASGPASGAEGTVEADLAGGWTGAAPPVAAAPPPNGTGVNEETPDPNAGTDAKGLEPEEEEAFEVGSAPNPNATAALEEDASTALAEDAIFEASG